MIGGVAAVRQDKRLDAEKRQDIRKPETQMVRAYMTGNDGAADTDETFGTRITPAEWLRERHGAAIHTTATQYGLKPSL